MQNRSGGGGGPQWKLVLNYWSNRANLMPWFLSWFPTGEGPQRSWKCESCSSPRRPSPWMYAVCGARCNMIKIKKWIIVRRAWIEITRCTDELSFSGRSPSEKSEPRLKSGEKKSVNMEMMCDYWIKLKLINWAKGSQQRGQRVRALHAEEGRLCICFNSDQQWVRCVSAVHTNCISREEGQKGKEKSAPI